MRSIRAEKGSGLSLDAIERQEMAGNRLAHGLNFYKLFWIFMCGGLVGFLLETLWCLATRLELQMRAGLVYGPFNPIYGAGALFMTLGLYRLRGRSVLLQWLVGAVVGSVLEYASSWLQEVFFSSESWNYSGMRFNLHGRINLLYSAFWGLLSVAWIRVLLPLLSVGIMKIPNRAMRPLTWVLFACMSLNFFVSGLAVTRWIQRESDTPAEWLVWHIMDERFPDERMETLYPNLKFIRGG